MSFFEAAAAVNARVEEAVAHATSAEVAVAHASVEVAQP